MLDYDLPDDLRDKLNVIVARFQSTGPVEPTGSVSLPRRYMRRLSNAETAPSLAGHVVEDREDDTPARERDLTTALEWIRQEIVRMPFFFLLTISLIISYVIYLFALLSDCN